MRIKTLFGTLLRTTYAASGGGEPLERFYAGVFASYFDHRDAQPGCAAVQAILRGERLPPWKLLQFYRDTQNPRCPDRLQEDLAALVACCFLGATQCAKLREALDAFLAAIPREDAADILQNVVSGDVVQLWTCLTWYALCSDRCG